MTHWIIKLSGHGAMLMGMTSYRYDAASGNYKQTRATRILMLVANVGTLLALPWVLMGGVEQMALVQWNPLMVITSYSYLVVRAVATIYPVLLRYRSEEQLSVIMATYLQLGKSYLNQLPHNAHVQQHFTRLLRAKFTALLMFCSATVVSFFSDKRSWSWRALLFLPFECSVLLITHMVTFHYFLLLWYMCRSSCNVNEELQRLVQQLQRCSNTTRRQCVASLLVALQRAMDTHWQVARLTRRISEVYCGQLLVVRFSGVTSTVVMCYYGAIFTYARYAPLGLTAYNLVLVFVMLYDIYLLDCISDLVVSSYVRGVYILRGCNNLRLRQRGAGVDEACELFVLRQLCWQLRLDTCGLFVPDKRFVFDCFASMLMCVVVLVQFHVLLS